MANVKVTSKWSIFEALDRHFNGFEHEVGKKIVEEMRASIAAGVSPVKGIGRFHEYSQSYKDAIQGKVQFFTTKSGQVVAAKPAKGEKGEKGLGHDKKVRPVNLELSGAMDAALSYKRTGEMRIEVGYLKGSKAVKEYASFHQSGNGKMPARPTIPQANDTFSARIMRVLRDLYGSRLTRAIKQSNKK